jgi:hypothetical protein
MIHVAGILTLTALAIGLYFRFVVLAGQPAATAKAIAALLLTLMISALFAAVSAWAWQFLWPWGSASSWTRDSGAAPQPHPDSGQRTTPGRGWASGSVTS